MKGVFRYNSSLRGCAQSGASAAINKISAENTRGILGALLYDCGFGRTFRALRGGIFVLICFVEPFFFVLQGIQIEVSAFFLEQFVMAALFHDLAF